MDYLARLGVGALYASPMLDAAPGSTHGYDVVDPTRARPELGGEQARVALAARLRAAGLGMVVDIVPNHMSVAVPKVERVVVGRAAARPRRRSTRGTSTSTGRAAGCCCPCWVPTTTSPTCGSTSDELVYYDHRFPIAPGTDGGTPQEVHDRQHYELVGWRRGNRELNYRRFFDITTLAAVRVEDPEVFDATHGEVLRWVADGDVTGLRVDHPDGLADPGGYLRRLRAATPEGVAGGGEDPGAGGGAAGRAGRPTGPSATTRCARSAACSSIRRASRASPNWRGRRGVATDFAAVQEQSRRLVTDTILVAEVRRIAALVAGVGPARRRVAAIAEIMIAFPVYRSYLPEGEEHLADAIGRPA